MFPFEPPENKTKEFMTFSRGSKGRIWKAFKNVRNISKNVETYLGLCRLTFNCSKLSIEALGKCVKCVKS